MEGVKRWISFFLPGGILFLAAVLTVSVEPLRRFIPTIIQAAPPVIFVSALLIGWRFNRSSLVFSVLILAAADAALYLWARGLPEANLSGLIVTHSVSLLLPINLMIFSMIKERGIFTRHGLIRLSFLIFQPVLLFVLARLNGKVLLQYLSMDIVGIFPSGSLPVSEPALMAFILACLVVTMRFMLFEGAKESGFFWSLVTLLTAFLSVGPGEAFRFYLAVSGLILLVSIIETSHAMAFKDELTGLPARRALKDDLLKLGNRYVLAMVDIDHFKKFNDTYGHDVGDQVLRMVAMKLAGVTGGGKAFRYGGEEFTVVFAGKHAENARMHLEQVRREVEAAEFFIRRRFRTRKKPRRIREAGSASKSVSVTVSIGMASCDDRQVTPQDVLKAADKALYRAKKQGRNCLCT
mgnify:CR=1 FL=1